MQWRKKFVKSLNTLNFFIVLFPIFKWNSAVCNIYRYILVEIHWSLIILHREQFGATSSFFSSVITTKSVVVCFKTHPEPGAGRVSSFISFTTRVLLRLMLYYAHLEQILTQRLFCYCCWNYYSPGQKKTKRLNINLIWSSHYLWTESTWSLLFWMAKKISLNQHGREVVIA